MKKLYKKYNKKYFDNKLPKVKLKYKTLDDAYGWTIGEGKKISIWIADDLTKKEMKETLRHEMIHVWQHINGKDMDHGKQFKKIATKLRTS